MQFRKHALLPLATAAAVCLCVPSAGASVARTAVSSRTLVSGSQSTSVVSIAIGHNRVPTRGHGGGHGGGHSGGHSSGHSRSGSSHRSSKQRHFRSGYVGSSYSDYDDDDSKATDNLEALGVFIVGGLGLYCLVKEDETEII